MRGRRQKVFWVWLTSTVGLLLLGTARISAEDDEELKLPSYVETCYRDDPKVAACIQRNIKTLVPMFRSGSKDFYLDPLEPIEYQDILLVYQSPVVGGRLMLPNLSASGMTHGFKVLDVRPNFKNPTKFDLNFDLHFPRVSFKTSYKLLGNIIRIPIDVQGRIEVDFIKVNSTFHVTGHTEEVGDSTFLELDGFTWNLIGEGIETAELKNEDLVDKYPNLNRMAKTVLRSQWRTLKQHLMPSLLREKQLTLTDMFSRFFKKYPYDVLLPRRTRTSNIGA